MERIQPGKYVELVYNIYDLSDGNETLIHQSDREDPERFVYGVDRGLLPALERELMNLEQGDEFSFTAKPEEAFGPFTSDLLVELPRAIFVDADGKFDEEMVKEGNALPMMTQEGQHVMGKVIEVTPDTVKMDFNHPLAGKTVKFTGTVLTVREATPEELQPERCGCGCNPANCGDGSCGDGCGDKGCGCE
ncbi:MAG: FKBP-type peptidyl-prolyl cis-trans isomerase [Bacteroidales bacterium]|nr:FKBP-type peptidyl-prolyl cis-trans isomerase [Bacteroidales bacterium]